MTMKHMRTSILFAVLLAVATPAAAQQVIFLVRHAERADGGAGASTPAPAPGMMANDPPLSAAGEQRAEKLAAMLAASGIRQIFVTEYRRTAQTAAPLAARLKLTPVTTSARNADALLEQVRRAEGNVVLVGHSNTLPELLKKLGIADTITIADSDYDDLFIVSRDTAGKVSLARLKY